MLSSSTEYTVVIGAILSFRKSPGERSVPDIYFGRTDIVFIPDAKRRPIALNDY